ncbi:M23 family metallopeptidase [Sphingomonas montana]|uniref:M23 family metallopeptidase n=1 Tax=Sphingomonas montana TaxID=1843236 RepID=UPI001F0A5AA7|nr:M23 family metallopeptidase [Sphingomonas montana]
MIRVLLLATAVPVAAWGMPPALTLPADTATQAARETGGARADGLMLSGAVRQGGLVRGTAPAGTTALTLDGETLAMAPDGRFLIGLDRDAPPTARLVATRVDGTDSVRMLAVQPGTWRIQSLPTLPKATPRTAEQIARRADEIAQIVAARATMHATDGWRQTPVWPVTGRISGVFGSQRIYAGEPGAYHGGVDIARPTGTPVASPLDGVVVLAAEVPFSLEGHLLLIDHGMGLGSAFLHLSRIDVRVGDRVTRGQPVGAIGATGRATGPHLHWAMTWNGRRIDPQPLAGAMAVNR